MSYSFKIWQLLAVGVVLFTLIALFAIFRTEIAEADDLRITCSAIEEAGGSPQELFDKNPVKYKKLDRDKDGKACE